MDEPSLYGPPREPEDLSEEAAAAREIGRRAVLRKNAYTEAGLLPSEAFHLVAQWHKHLIERGDNLA